MHRFNRRRAGHEQHVWVPLCDLLFVVVGALILQGIDTRSRDSQQVRIYRSLEDAKLVRASSEGGTVPSADGVIKVEPSGEVILRGQRVTLGELREHVNAGSPIDACVLAIAADAKAGDAQRVELILRESNVKYTRLFRKQSGTQEAKP